MQSVYVVGAGVCLPNQAVKNENLENILGVINGVPSRTKTRIMAGTGITSRHYAIDPETRKQTHTNAQMTSLAVKDAVAKYKLPIEVDLLCSGSSSPDQMVPSHGLMVHGELNIPALEVMTAAGVCCSGVTALKYAFMSIASGCARRAITTGSELVSNLFKSENLQKEITLRKEDEEKPTLAFQTDFLRWVLSDGAGALYLANEPAPNRLSLKIDWVDIVSFAHKLETCMYSGGQKDESGKLVGWREVDPDTRIKEGYLNLSQDVRLLNANIANITIDETMPILMERHHDLKAENIDWFLPHYSSAYFRPIVHEHLAKSGLPIPYEKWFTNLTEKGNTGSASIYIMIDELYSSGKLKKGDRILCFIPESARFSVGYMHLTVV